MTVIAAAPDSPGAVFEREASSSLLAQLTVGTPVTTPRDAQKWVADANSM